MSKVLKTIVNVILFCAIVVAAGLLIPPFAGVTTVMVDDVDMQTNCHRDPWLMQWRKTAVN